ncbi:hypothetical protein JHK84_043665 [Glycine max]|nr:hypothetical protein JHK86_043478 [Glycine max]KAG5117552.1 hypothetical protein JHK84_043665 [Glycine max]
MASIGGGQQPNKEEKLLLSLHKERSWSSPYVYLFQEFWCLSTVILVTSLPKSAIFNDAFFSTTGSSSTALFIGSSASTLVADSNTTNWGYTVVHDSVTHRDKMLFHARGDCGKMYDSQ